MVAVCRKALFVREKSFARMKIESSFHNCWLVASNSSRSVVGPSVILFSNNIKKSFTALKLLQVMVNWPKLIHIKILIWRR